MRVVTALVRIFPAVLLALTATTGVAAATNTSELRDLRAIFSNAYASAEKGQWALSPREEKLLGNYVLWPDLREKYLQVRLRKTSPGVIYNFLAEHAGTSAARSLRYSFAIDRAKRGDWPAYLKIYNEHYAKLDNTKLDCLALTGQLKTKRTVNGALAVRQWLRGKSQPKECDPIFAWLGAEKLLTRDLIEQRFRLALDAKSLTLATYLARRLGPAERAEASAWRSMRKNPQKQLSTYRTLAREAGGLERIAYGLQRLARKDTTAADLLFQQIRENVEFAPETGVAIAEYIALVASWRHEPEAGRLIAAVPAEHRSDELLGWQVRAALRTEEWPQILAAISSMTADEADNDNWRYWQARALIETDRAEAGLIQLGQLAAERSYYGFLAADHIETPYSFAHEPLPSEGDVIAQLGNAPELIRARELFLTGLTSRGRSEWDAYIATLDGAGKVQAALLAHEWDWHSRAIATAASAGRYDDLAVRYPLPWQDWFDESSRAAKIEPAWAYGIARNESLFMRDIKSSAGAVGLMQLMPATGRQTAKAASVAYHGLATLVDPQANIQLGTRYLGDMFQRFGRNKVLATAAYNAGPHRVDRWLPNDSALATEVWIETIPYDETRKYVQRVLEADTVFHWRMTDSTRRVSSVFAPIRSPLKQAAVPRRGKTPGG